MKLGDLFWIKKFKLKKDDYKFDDTIKLMELAKQKNIELTFIEAYTLWECFSGKRYVSWHTLTDEYAEDFFEELFEMFDMGE